MVMFPRRIVGVIAIGIALSFCCELIASPKQPPKHLMPDPFPKPITPPKPYQPQIANSEPLVSPQEPDHRTEGEKLRETANYNLVSDLKISLSRTSSQLNQVALAINESVQK